MTAAELASDTQYKPTCSMVHCEVSYTLQCSKHKHIIYTIKKQLKIIDEVTNPKYCIENKEASFERP